MWGLGGLPARSCRPRPFGPAACHGGAGGRRRAGRVARLGRCCGRRWGLVSVVALAFAGRAEAEEGKSSDILEVMAWCKDLDDGLDWGQVLRLAKVHCNDDAEGDSMLRVQCTPEGLGAAVSGAKLVLEHTVDGVFACANGIAFLLGVALVYASDLLSAEEVARAKVLLWKALQENFMVDASVWPVKTYDILQIFDRMPPALDFPPLEATGLDAVTLVVPRCPPALADVIRERFAGARVMAGLDSSENLPETWTHFDDASLLPVGSLLNRMLQAVETPLTLVVLGSALPLSGEDVARLARVLEGRRVLAAGGPLVDDQRVYMDFCYKLQLRHYHLGFSSTYEHSLIFDENSAASIRGSWFHEEDTNSKDGPCKLCETLPPTFLSRTSALRAIGFHPILDGEWALLDFAARATRTPLIEVLGEKANGDTSLPGRRHVGGLFALCPFVNMREVSGLGAAHLYGRGDKPASGVSPAEPWFGDERAALGPVLGSGPNIQPLRPAHQAKLFMDVMQLREFTGPDGIKRHFGCNLGVTNCPVPNWVYRGWAVPPCCKETMRHLLFYIDEVFREVGVRYIVTDGVLLGSYKFGGMMDWDADVDLHIHSEDFHLLEEVVQHRAKRDGHFLRKHANNNSWLLQANDHNYLLIELNLRKEHWDPDAVWHVPINGKLFPAMEEAHLNLSSWYGLSFFKHRLRHVPEWEEELRPMYCCTPYHFNCVDESQVPSGSDCRRAGIC